MSKRYTEEEFIDAVKTCYSVASALHKIGLKSTGANYDLFRIRVKKLGLSTDHFTGKSWSGGKKLGSKTTRIPTEEICVEESTYTCTHSLKKRLLEELLLVNICYECGIDAWNGKPLVLQLDHINGNRRDNRVENLRMICPNCHSQTHTFAGKNKKSVLTNKCKSCETLIKSDRKYCKTCFSSSQYKEFSENTPTGRTPRYCPCGKEISHTADTCKSCVPRESKITWPSKEELEKMVWEKSTVQISKELGVSDKAVEKFCKKKGIDKPPRGYWAKCRVNQ